MLYPVIAVILGIAVLIWSADKFVEGAAAVAERLGMSHLLIGMVIVGFGTSLPEMLVSALSAWQGAPGIALGNAYGSNIANITLILGVTALVNPVPVNPGGIGKELIALVVATVFAAALIAHGLSVTRLDAVLHLVVFAVLMGLSMRRGCAPGKGDDCPVPDATEDDIPGLGAPLGRSIFWVVAGLLLLLASSRALVWGAVEIARALEISELTIGLTIVAVGTSLPELASSLAAARKNHHDIAVGNVIGSNLFNTLMVIGIAGVIKPMAVPPAVLYRDLPAVGFATLVLVLFCLPRKSGRTVITRGKGVFLLCLFVLYNAYVMLHG
ncbi:MAG: calcium/sodium antiporter [Planctomycetes bacterium]|nr:calcium/sodium antiporter [Planctomycetota bacterium]